MNENQDRDSNPDPITGAPGAHPIGVGVGAASAGAAGAAIGAVGGPIGSAVGAVIGAVAGGLAGKGVAEAVDPTVEDAYWRENHAKQAFAKDRAYDEFAPAYRTGYDGYSTHGAQGRRFEDAEPELRQHYETTAGTKAKLAWDDAKHAARAAWSRVEHGGQTRH
jgi:hypothetical protein